MTTQQERTCSVLKPEKKTWQSLPSLCGSAAVQLFYFCLILSHIIQTKKKEREEKGPKAIFEKE